MPVSKAQQKAVNKYMSANYDRINLTVPKGYKDEIKAHAEAQGESVNGFISRAIKEMQSRDSMGVFDVALKCPYQNCGHTWTEDLSDFVINSDSYVRQMGAEIEHTIEADLCCPQCNRDIEAAGSVWEYPDGVQNYADIHTVPAEDGTEAEEAGE